VFPFSLISQSCAFFLVQKSFLADNFRLNILGLFSECHDIHYFDCSLVLTLTNKTYNRPIISLFIVNASWFIRPSLNILHHCVRFEVIMAMTMWNAVFLEVAPCGPASYSQRFSYLADSFHLENGGDTFLRKSVLTIFTRRHIRQDGILYSTPLS
jgi:hypothetical protein